MSRRFTFEISKQQWQEQLMPHKEGFFVVLQVKPNSSREKLSLSHDNRLVLSVHDAALEGAANQRVIEIMAAVFMWPKSKISIASGEASRIKKILMKGRSVSEQLEQFNE